MTRPSVSEITQLLIAWSNGDKNAQEQLIPLVYDELRHLAAKYLRREHSAHLLQTTALVHEAYLKLIDIKAVQWQSRAHFFGIAAKLMRQILVDYARSRNASKRGGDALMLPIENINDLGTSHAWEITTLNDALDTLYTLDSRQGQVVEYRFFGGMTNEEIGEILNIDERTVKRDWSAARAWLLCELQRK
ncbi:MAG: sigma-70 family RNA polymerase sigma factor [Acidobacteriota bacterium]